MTLTNHPDNVPGEIEWLGLEEWEVDFVVEHMQSIVNNGGTVDREIAQQILVTIDAMRSGDWSVLDYFKQLKDDSSWI